MSQYERNNSKDILQGGAVGSSSAHNPKVTGSSPVPLPLKSSLKRLAFSFSDRKFLSMFLLD